MVALLHTQSTQILSLSSIELIPTPGPAEYLIKNEATALTTGELFWPRPPHLDTSVPGVEASGTIIHAPEKGGKFKPGDKVYHRVQFPNPGGACEYSTATEDVLALRPRNLSAAEAAAVPVSALTAWQGCFEQAGLKADFRERRSTAQHPRILINGASGGAGNWFVQLAHAAGYHVTATCSSRNVELVRSLGADEIIDYTTSSLLSYGRFDLVFDTVGGKSGTDAFRTVTAGGRFFTICPPGEFEDFANWKWDLELPEGCSPDVTGKFFLMRADGEQLGNITALIEQGMVRPIMDSVWTLEQYEAAFERLRSGKAIGKVVLKV